MEYKASMKKEKPDMETFAAGVADKEDNPTIHELAKTFPEKTYKELEEYRNSDRQEEANQVPLTEAQRNLVEHIEEGACIMGEMRKDREEINWKEKYKKENNDLFNRVADALAVNESHQRLNGELQVRMAELEDENKTLHKHLDKRIEAARKAGL